MTTEAPKMKARLGKNVDQQELKRLPAVIRSKFLVYLEPKGKVSEAQKNSKIRIEMLKKQRILERKQELERMQESNTFYSNTSLSNNTPAVVMLKRNDAQSLDEAEKLIKMEKERNDRLIGELKAAEAKNRLKSIKLRYLNLKQDELEDIIESQPSAMNAVRLDAFLPLNRSKEKTEESTLDQPYISINQVRRIEALVDDQANTFITRKFY